MATALALRRVAFTKRALIGDTGGSYARAALGRLGDGVCNPVAVPSSTPLCDVGGNRRFLHDDAPGRGGRSSFSRRQIPFLASPSVNGEGPNSLKHGVRGLVGGRNGEAVGEELLEQLGTTLPLPRPSSQKYSYRRKATAGSVRTKRRRRSHPIDSNSLYAQRSLSLRERDGASGEWSRLTTAEEADDDSDVIARLRVKSVHAANYINVADVLSKVFGGGTMRESGSGDGNDDEESLPKLRALRHVFGKTSLVVQLPPVSSLPSHDDHRGRSGDASADDGGVSEVPSELELPRYVAVYRFGSVVFFNVSTKDAGRILKSIKRCGAAGDPVSSGFERRENFEVAVRPGMEETAFANGDFATVGSLDMNSVAVIGTILGQTVAIDSYSDTVDELLASFAAINSTVKKTGSFTDMEKAGLFKVVAQNNSLFIDMTSKLGIKDRSDTAWNLSQYERVWDDMREEFEIDERFSQIEFKLDLIQQNAKFFLEMLHHQKTNSLEWIIVVLIGFECVLMCLDMSGMGEVAFAALPFNPFNLAPPK